MKNTTLIAIAERIGRATPYVVVSAALADVALIVAYFAWGFEHYGIINAVMVCTIAAVVWGCIGIPLDVIAAYCSNPEADPDNESCEIRWHVGRALMRGRR